jgi:hypothetical protein
MNPNPRAKVKWYKNFEDADFVRLNCQIIVKCGANWKKPPKVEHIAGYVGSGVFDDRIKKLVSRRNGLWGFKDPRTAITIPIIHPHLTEPKYIRVTRPFNDIAKSLMSRGGNIKRDRWLAVIRQYGQHIDNFFDNVDAPKMSVSFNDLLDKKKSKGVIQSIADFVGCGNVDKALKRINYQRK